MPSVEDTLYEVQNILINGENTISTELLKEIEQHLVDYAVIVRGAEEFKRYVEKIAKEISDGL